MALTSAKFSALAVVLLVLPSHWALAYFNDCGVKLRVVELDGAESPLILKFQDGQQRHILQIFHPSYLDGECLVRNLYVGSGLVSFACLSHYLRMPGLKSWPDKVRLTSLLGSHQGTFDNFSVITPEHPTAIPFDRMSAPIKCTGPLEPTIKELAAGKYQIGYQMNAIDFLPVFDLSFSEHLTFAHAKILSINARRPRIHEQNESLRNGPIFQHLPLAAPTLPGKTQLSSSKFNDTTQHHLVHGQLLSKDDLFYIPEQRTTFFLENTALIWNSIYEGNWKMLGDIVRSLASETVTDLDVYSGTLECLPINKSPIDSYQLPNSTKHTCVPKFLFKIALDKRFDSKRAMVFITVNDPNIEIAQNASIPSDLLLCNKKSECDQLYPEFLSPAKGYTYCCDLQDFAPWKEIQNSTVQTEVPDVLMPFYGAYPGKALPPPPPPPPLGPIYRPVP